MTLNDLYQELYGLEAKFTKEHCEELAGKMSKAINRRPAWTGDNIYRVLKGFKGFAETEEMKRAAGIILNQRDGQNELQARLHQKLFWTTNGIHEDTIIHGVSFTCEHPACNVKMLKTHPAMRYCLLHGKRRKVGE